MKALEDILSISAIFDVRTETLAATFLAQADGNLKDFGLEQLVVAARGNAKRRSGNDVAGAKRKFYDHDTVLLIEVNRKGLFDTLPERLFLRLDEEYKDAKTRTKAITQQIAEARKFFLPFEQAIYHPRIEAEQLEQKYTETFPEFINNIWGLPDFADCLDERQRFLLCYLLPEAYRVVGNWKLTGLCFEAVLQKPVNLQFIAPMELEIPNSDLPSNEMRLGDDAIVGETFKDDMPALEVIIKGVTYSDLPEFLPGGAKRRILEELLYNYFLPLDVAVITKIKVTEDTLGFDLGEAILGFNIQIQNIN